MAAVEIINDDGSEYGYCVAVMAGRGTKKWADKRTIIYPVESIVYEHEITHELVPCTGIKKFDNNERTYRVSVPSNDKNGKEMHARIVILHYSESKADAKKYIEEECVKKRIRLPKLLELTPEVSTQAEPTRMKRKRKVEKENAEATSRMKQLKAIREKSSVKMEDMLMTRKQKEVLSDLGNLNVPNVFIAPCTTMVDANDVLKESHGNIQTSNASKDILKEVDGESILQRRLLIGKKKKKKSRKRKKFGNHKNETSGTVDSSDENVVKTLISNVKEGTVENEKIHGDMQIVVTPKLCISSDESSGIVNNFNEGKCDKPINLQKSVTETINSNVQECILGYQEIHENSQIVVTPKVRITSSKILSTVEARRLKDALLKSASSPPMNMNLQSVYDEKAGTRGTIISRSIQQTHPIQSVSNVVEDKSKVSTRKFENCRRDIDDYVGIQNKGSTCFLISVLQVLNSITEFRKAVSKKSTTGKISQGVKMLEEVFQKLDDRVKQIDTRKLEQYYAQTTDMSFENQQDSNEMLDVVLESMRETDQHGKLVPCELSELYTGMEVHCATNFAGEAIPKCATLQPFNKIVLDAKDTPSIESALKAYAVERLIEVRCAAQIQCNGTEIDEVKVSYTKVPKILFVHVQQSWWDPETQSLRKYNNRFTYSKEIDLKHFFDISNDQETRYTLQSVIAHQGTGEMGHYVAFIDRNCRGNWYRCDDEVVEKCTAKNATTDNYGDSEGDVNNAPYEAWRAHLLVYQLSINSNSGPETERTDNCSSESPTLPLIVKHRTECMFEDEETRCQEKYKNRESEENAPAKNSNNREGTKKRTSGKGSAKKSDNSAWQSKSMLDKMDVMHNSLVRLEETLRRIEKNEGNNHRNVDNQEQQVKDVFEIPEKPDENGMVTTINGRRVYLDPYLKAADQTQMRRRVNFVLYALWSQEERLALSFNKTHNQQDCKKITKEDVDTIRQICVYLQNGKEANGCNHLYTSKLRNWVSNKLNSDRHRLKLHGIENKKHKRRAQHKYAKGTKSSSGKDYTSTEEEDTETESENVGTAVVTARPFSHLEFLLARQRYPRDYSSSEIIASAPVCGWQEIAKEMSWNNVKLQSIMTPDSYVTLDGKCYILEIKYELEALTAVIKKVNETKQDTGKNLQLDMGNEKETYSTAIVDYIIKKYFIDHTSDDASRTPLRCNIEKVHKALTFKYLLLPGEDWNYYEIISRIRTCMGKLGEYGPIKDETIRSWEEFIVKEENYRTTICLKNRSEFCSFDGMAIMKKNNSKSQASCEKNTLGYPNSAEDTAEQ